MGKIMVMNNENNNLVLGITGTNGAGKDTGADFFKQKGWNIYSHSDELRKIANKVGVGKSRNKLVELGNRLRRDYDNGILSNIIIGKLEKPAVILSIRHPEEVEVYRDKLENFYLLGIDAPVELRYKRSKERNREGEGGLTFEEFKKNSNREMEGQKEAQQLKKVLSMTDFAVENASTLDDFYKKLEKVYNQINHE